MNERVPVNNIINFSNVDGPGNRMAIFFQKCNMSCTYCHNPETINICKNCLRCVRVCPAEALSIDENKNVIWDKDLCTQCDNCIKICPFLSSPKITNYNVDELVKEIKKVKIFIQGITVSGGESTLYADFLTELFQYVKKENISCFVDTNGSLDLSLEKYKSFVEATDQFMLDVKAWNLSEHKKLTGISNEKILKNLSYLLSINKVYEVRTVVNSMIDSEETIINVSKILSDYPNVRYKIIKYRPYGVLESNKSKFSEISSQDFNALEKLAIKNGASNVIML